MIFLKIFCSQTVIFDLSNRHKQKNPNILRPKRKEFTDAVENIFLRKVQTCLKLQLEKIALEMLCCHTVTFHLSRICYIKKK